MSRLLLAAALIVLPSLAAAQSVEGNWHCRAGDMTAGLLTIYGPSYIYAGTAFGDPASGGGALLWEGGGVRFVDGNLVTVLGVNFGQMIVGGGVVPMDLIGNDTVLLSCVKRLEVTTFDLPLEGFPPPVTDVLPPGSPAEPTAPPVPLTRPPGL
jgi:hypothetical protein